MRKVLPIIFFVIIGLALMNLIVLDVLWLRNARQKRISSPPEPPAFLPTPIPTTVVSSRSDFCGPVCQATIDQKIAAAVATLSGRQTVQETTTVVKETSQTVSQPQVIYIPLGGGGSTTATDWADVGNAEVYLNIGDYANVDKVYFEGFIKVKHGNGKAYARLYDVTHGIGVQGGEISTSSEDYTLVESGSLSLWQGKNLYRVQIKSLNGYEAFFDSGRIKIIIK